MTKTQTPIYELVETEKQPARFAWAIQVDGKEIGAVGINLEDTDELESPAVHVAIEDANPRGSEIEIAVLKDMISYAYRNIPSEHLYSRYETSSLMGDKLLKQLGFEKDGDPYVDDDGLKWQNVVLVV